MGWILGPNGKQGGLKSPLQLLGIPSSDQYPRKEFPEWIQTNSIPVTIKLNAIQKSIETSATVLKVQSKLLVVEGMVDM